MSHLTGYNKHVTEMLLRTKLFVPQVRPSLVPRLRLFAKLDHGLEAKLTLVSAPAGYGKTTLVADWLRHSAAASAFRFCWLSLDESDNDLARFIAYLAAALDTIEPGALLSVAEMIGSQRNLPVETAATLLINDAAQIAKPFVLVLDDYQVINDEAIHEAVSFLLDHLPPQMRLLIIGRADPPLPVARLRGQGQLMDVRQQDLRFNAKEATKFLNQVMHLDLTADDIRLLNERTEGWVAGLQMAAVSIQEREDSSAFIQAFTGSHRYILDYLLEEVLQRQKQTRQRFLLETSLLDRFTAPLCQTILAAGDDAAAEAGDELPDAQMTLEQLDAANLFVVPLDDRRHWYRYHRLFADLLRQRLQQAYPHRVPIIHRRASQWFEEQNLLLEAFDHALASEDYTRATTLAERMAEGLLRRSEIATLIKHVQMLPIEQVQERPLLSLYYAWAHLLIGSPLQTIENYLPQATGESRLDSIAVLIQAFLAVFRGDLSLAQDLSRRAMADLDGGERFWRSQAAWILSMIQSDILQPPAEGGLITLDEAVRIGLQSGDLVVSVSAMCEQAHILRRHGRLHEARALYEEALALAVDKSGQLFPIAGEALMGLGQVAFEWNDLQVAEEQLLAGIEKTLLWREIAAFTGYLLLSQLRQAQGDWAGAGEAMDEAWRLAQRFDVTEFDDVIVAAYEARLWIFQNRLDEAARWAAERGLLDDHSRAREGADFQQALRCYEEIVLARLRLGQGDPEAALSLLKRNLHHFESWGRVRLLLEALLLRVRACLELGDRQAAMDALRQAVILGAPGEHIRVFLDEGETITRLLERVKVDDPGQQAYIERILSGGYQEVRPEYGQMPPAIDYAEQPLIEPLSERELEVLALIAAGFTNREIARQLVISLPTVKWHSSNIYGKLGVKNRTKAVARAQELNLLPAD